MYDAFDQIRIHPFKMTNGREIEVKIDGNFFL